MQESQAVPSFMFQLSHTHKDGFGTREKQLPGQGMPAALKLACCQEERFLEICGAFQGCIFSPHTVGLKLPLPVSIADWDDGWKKGAVSQEENNYYRWRISTDLKRKRENKASRPEGCEIQLEVTILQSSKS